MENHIIIKEDGSRLPWNTNRLNKKFCLLYHDNNKKYIFTPQTDLKCQLFMIGGGGAGGYYFGGGGGAGAAYINNNFTFEQGKTYTFSIGTGGTCDIKNFDNLFNSGLSLNVYNNTTPNFNNLSFNYDDYSSLGINASNIMHSYIVDNINITPTIFNTNTTYIWNGYIKSNNNVITIRLNSKLNVYVWVNTYHFTLDNASIKTNGVGNAEEFKVLQLDPNKFYNIKIIAYNNDSSNANFNISFENCDFFNFNKNYENYNVVPATDTIMTFKSVSSNENNVIICKGGGTGGYGLYNNNTNLNGGCGGGSGINKIKGLSINNNPIYNGFDGAIGDYCGGGGGIISQGNNDVGGEGKILNWFNETLLFGAGGNGATNNQTRNLGYGCGGNGGDCCYFSKSLINNNGNNGCILIYEDTTIEHFTNPDSDVVSRKKIINYFDKYKDSIAVKLINESYRIADLSDDKVDNISLDSRKKYFEKSLSFGKLALNDTTAIDGLTDNNDMHNFIYDTLVISKIYAIAYRLLYHHYKINCTSDIITFANSMKNTRITFTNELSTSTLSAITYSSGTPDMCIINFNNLFSIENLGLNADKTKANYAAANNIYISSASGTSTTVGCPNMVKEVFDTSINEICGKNNQGYHIPLYHYKDGTKSHGLKLFYDNTSNSAAYDSNINKISTVYTKAGTDNIYETSNTSNTSVKIEFYNNTTGGFLDNTVLEKLKQNLESNITNSADNINEYKFTRIILYLEAFNNILNLNPYNTLLPTLKYQMYNYNSIVYNVAIQYQLFTYQNSRVALKEATLTYNTTTTYSESGKQTPLSGSTIIKSGNSQNWLPSAIPNGTTVTISTATTFATPSDTSSQGSRTYPTLTTVQGYATNLQKDIYNFKYNLDDIILLNINTPDVSEDTLNTIVELQKQKQNTDNTFATNQLSLNETINSYNSEFQNYNKILYYYKIIIIIALFLILLIFFIFTLKSIDNNTKIVIYICILLIIIIVLAYYNNFTVNEKFTIINNKAEKSSIIFTDSSGTYDINFASYKRTLNNYVNKLNKFITSGTIDSDILKPLKVFNDNIDNVRKNKAEYYKLKKINLENAIDIIKKSANSYYLLSIFIILCTLVLLFTLILLLINPNMLMQIISVAAIFMIIVIFYISYQINKPTRLSESKNYWANYNPSKDTLKSL